MKDIQLYKHPYSFYFLATVIPWTLWLIVAYLSHAYPGRYVTLASVMGFIGLMAPFIIALYLIIPNQKLRKDFFGRFFNFREVKAKYLIITCLLMLTSIVLAQLVSLGFGYPIDQFIITGSYSFTSGVFPVWALLIVAPIIEELAWHSYGTDCLRTRFNLFNTSMLFALYWGIWHIPLSLIKDYYQSNLVESGVVYSINFIVSLFPFVIIMNWLYYKSNRNILIPIIFHITAGYFNEIFSTHPMSKVIQTILLLLLSGYIIVNNKTFFFKS